MDMSLEETIRKYALQNAVQYKGKCNPGAVIGKVIAETKKDQKEIAKKAQSIIKEVNNLSLEEQQAELKAINPKLLEKKKQEKTFSLPKLKNTKKVVMRFAPNPNGAMSFGHSRQALLNWWFVQEYKGTYILRFDDTDPRTKVPLKEAYKWFEEDLAWLGIKPKKVINQSDRFDLYYNYVEQIIAKDKAYVCTCEVEVKRKLIHNKESCPCRELFHGETLERWKQMLDPKGYKEGEAVLRIKTDVEANNPAVRDWPACRIITDGKHPLKKAKVWPLLNFSSAIDDHELGITHIVRGIDLAVSDERQQYLYDIFSWTYPETIYTGKLVVQGVQSTSESKKLIDAGKLDGWDDIRLATLQTLRKRGFQPEAIHEFVKSVGVNRNNVEVSLQNVEAFNKDVIDEQANRYFFIENPIMITVEKAPKQKVELDLYPEKRRGGRTFTTNEAFLVEKKDADQWKEGELIRLMDCLNFTKKGKRYVFHSLDYGEFKGNGKHIIHWLPKEETIPVKVRKLDNKVITGKGEKTITNVKKQEIVQFERFGFCKKNEEFWFTQ